MIKPTRSSEVLTFELLGSHAWERIKTMKLPVDTIDWLYEQLEDMYYEGHQRGWHGAYNSMPGQGVEAG